MIAIFIIDVYLSNGIFQVNKITKTENQHNIDLHCALSIKTTPTFNTIGKKQ